MDQNDDVYIDLLVSNSVQTNSNSRVATQFYQSSSQPIIKSTNGYKMSIIRFALDTQSLPIFIPSMTSTNTTAYSFTMEYNGVQYQQFMEFIPQNLKPQDPDEYYYVYSYQYVVYLLNGCLQSCFAGLKALTGCPLTVCPVLSFDNSTQKCSLNLGGSVGYNSSGTIKLYMNFAMNTLLSSLPMVIVKKDVAGMDYQINNIIGPSMNVLTQEISTIALWNPVSSILFTSNLIPIYQSQTPPLQVYQNGQLINNASNFNSASIMTDFIADNLNFVSGGYVQYAPALYRYLSLRPNSEIRNLDLQVYWMRKDTGVMKKLYIGVGNTCSVKLFLTKNF
jgi:hypothetical protein